MKATAVVLLSCSFILSACDSNGRSSINELSSADTELCAKYISLFSDMASGILTDAEARGRIKDLYGRSTGGALETEARDMLSGWTTGDGATRKEAIRQVTLTCTGRDIVAEQKAEDLRKKKEKACGEYLQNLSKLIDRGGSIDLNEVSGWGTLIDIEAKHTSVEPEAKAVYEIAHKNEAAWIRDTNGMAERLREKISAMNLACARTPASSVTQ